MVVTIKKPEFIGTQTVKVRWSSNLSDPLFSVFKDGFLIDITKQTEKIFLLNPGESLIIEILDDPSLKPAIAFSSRLTLGWYPSAGAKSYRIDEFVGAGFVEVTNITDNEEGFFIWKTRPLEDDKIHQFRIVPIGLNDVEGTIRNFTVLMVRHPNPPDQNFSYSEATKQLTVS